MLEANNPFCPGSVVFPLRLDLDVSTYSSLTALQFCVKAQPKDWAFENVEK